MVDQTDPIVYKLQALMEKYGKGYKQLSKDSGVPEVTAKRIITGVTQKPSITDVIKLWKAMGGTAAELFDDNFKVDIAAETPQVVVPQIDEKLYNEILRIYKDSIKTKDMWIKILFGLVAVLVVFIIAVCIVDILHGGIGYVRY